MRCFFRSFDVGIGDCNVIRLVKGDGTQYVIMVDCGKYTTAIKSYVEGTLHNHINLLVATHIDGDHIKGMAAMLKKCPNLQIDKIWYNCYGRCRQNVGIVGLTEEQMEVLNWVKNALPVEFDAINYKKEISAEQGKTLAGEILRNDAWKNVWNTDYVTYETPDVDLPDDFGKIVLLGPTRDSLDELERRIKDAFNSFFMQVWNDNLKDAESLSELLIRLADAYKEKFEAKQISASTPDNPDAAFVKKAAEEEGADTSDTNYSSIAFMLESGGHRVAMLGDAFAITLEKAINQKYENEKKPIVCDAIKVSHHGSNGNNSKILLDTITSHKFFIPGGRKNEYPTWGTLGRIALSHQNEDNKLIVFSHKGDMSIKMNELDIQSKEELKIETIITEQEYELFEW